MAIWDAVAKIAGKPLFRLLAERHGVAADPRVFVYAAGGDYYPGKEVEGLRAEMRSYLRKRIEVVLMEIRSDPRAVLSGADGNGREPLQPSGCTQPGALWGMRPDRDWLQFDCALSYDLCEHQRTLGLREEVGWSASRCIPHGGHQVMRELAE